jgi:hypothetical protein
MEGLAQSSTGVGSGLSGFEHMYRRAADENRGGYETRRIDLGKGISFETEYESNVWDNEHNDAWVRRSGRRRREMPRLYLSQGLTGLMLKATGRNRNLMIRIHRIFLRWHFYGSDKFYKREMASDAITYIREIMILEL